MNTPRSRSTRLPKAKQRGPNAYKDLIWISAYCTDKRVGIGHKFFRLVSCDGKEVRGFDARGNEVVVPCNHLKNINIRRRNFRIRKGRLYIEQDGEWIDVCPWGYSSPDREVRSTDRSKVARATDKIGGAHEGRIKARKEKRKKEGATDKVAGCSDGVKADSDKRLVHMDLFDIM